MDKYISLTGKLDRRNPRDRGKEGDVWLMENLLSRDGRTHRPGGTTKAITTILGDTPRWIGRYHTVEIGAISPKTFAYTKDGRLYLIDETAKTATELLASLNTNAFPKHWLVKYNEQTYLYLVDGKNLYKYDGNNANKFDIVDVSDADGTSIEPIDVMEHIDRLCLISKTHLYISGNLAFDTFSSATDSLAIVVGSGKGQNLSFAKIDETLYVMNTEAKYKLIGDTISALAVTFSIDPIEFKVNNIISSRTAVNCERAIYFLAEDLEVYRFNGSSSEKVSHYANLKELINPYRDYLDMAVATYEDNYYKLSFVETERYLNNLEYWYDTVENRDDFVRGRNVSCYMNTDPTIELPFKLIGRTDQRTICFADRGASFDGVAIRSRLWTKDTILEKNHNSRISNFYIDAEPTQDFNLNIYYALDGRLNPNDKAFAQNLYGETRTLGLIQISNQNQFTDRAKPQINYAKGESVGFYIDDSTLNMDICLKVITVEFVVKEKKKGRRIGQ